MAQTTDRPPDLGAAAARGTAVTLVVQVARVALQFGSVVVLARLLVPEDFGLVAMVTAVIGAAELLRDFGLSTAAMQSPTLSDGERNNLFWANAATGLLCSLLAVAATPLVVRLYDEPRLVGITLALSPVFVMSGLATQFRAGLARELRFKALSMADLWAQLLSTALAIALAWAGLGLWALVWAQLANGAATAILFAAFAGWLPTRPDPRVSIRRFFRFGIGVFGTQSIGYLTKNIDNIAIGAAYGAVPLGLYSRAYTLMRMPITQLNAPMNNVALPVLRHVQADDREFMHYLARAQMVLMYPLTIVFAMCGGLAAPLVLVLFGSKWTGVGPILAVLAIAGVFRALAGVPWWGYLARGHSASLFAQRLVTGGLSVLAIFAGLPWGAVGVAWGVVAGSVISWVVGVWHMGRTARVDARPLFSQALYAILLLGIPCWLVSAATTLLSVGPLAQLGAGACATAVYLLLANLLLPPLRRDCITILRLVRRAVRSRSTTSQPA